ncbi:MAG: serine/threonine protein kinase [Actinobacteria bacterium]|nr:serine/threonine protein kinase [Actinomycetota bacterium]
MVEAAKLSNRYQIEDRIASGGMGTVFAATDERLGRRVAVKMLRGDLADDDRFVERFRREALAVAGLSHPNIANVYDYGEDDDKHFIVMEFAEGSDLSHILGDGVPLDPERATEIAVQACDALGHAHASGIVHRDVKPANIIVSGYDRVKVTDFGIARAVGDATLTATGSILGTANYLSPEQAAGGSIGPASDVYSMGLVLYEMLTGSTPFSGDTPIAVAMSHVSEQVPAPSALNDDVPPELDRIVATATAKEPGERYADGNEMAAALGYRDRARAAGAAAGVGVAAAVTASAAPTEAMGAGGTRQMTASEWPPAGAGGMGRAARIVGLALAGLALLALILLLVQLTSGDQERPRTPSGAQQQDQGQTNPAQDPPHATPQESPTEQAEPELLAIPSEGVVGSNFEDATDTLQADGFTVVTTPDTDSEEDPGIVTGTDPEAGTEVEPGSEVTLFVSTGPPEEGGEEESGEESAAPGNSEGKGKSKGKDKDKDEGD